MLSLVYENKALTSIFAFAEKLAVRPCPRSTVYFTTKVFTGWDAAEADCVSSGGALARTVTEDEAYMLEAFM